MASLIDVRLFVVFFLSLPRLVRVCEIESHMGKNNGNPDLMCEKILIFGPWIWRCHLISIPCKALASISFSAAECFVQSL